MMDFYGIGEMSMAMSSANVKREASIAVMKNVMDMAEVSLETLMEGLGGEEFAAALTGLGQNIDISV